MNTATCCSCGKRYVLYLLEADGGGNWWCRQCWRRVNEVHEEADTAIRVFVGRLVFARHLYLTGRIGEYPGDSASAKTEAIQ